ncbi:Tetratricopeptide repeat protein 1 [Gryllus bimaculatus]|nr:Tetratricopeptide repeat protein 1 [Gryllus bimaculatus]
MAEKSCGDVENPASKAIPTNEEIVEEVMKGVKDCLIEKSDDTSEKKDDVKCREPGTNEQEASKLRDNERVDTQENVSINGDDDTKSELDDFIDELSLKDAEDTFSDEEKEQRRLEADICKAKGNDQFKSGAYRESIQNYTLGLRTCPLAFPKERSIMFSNRAAAKMKLVSNYLTYFFVCSVVTK